MPSAENSEYAIAAYLEFHGDPSGGQVAQFFVLPEFKRPSTGTIVPMQIMTRTVSKANPQKSWRFASPENAVPSRAVWDAGDNQPIRGTDGDFSLYETLKDSSEYYSNISGPLTSMQSQMWRYAYPSQVIGISEMDAEDIAQAIPPRGLRDRLIRLREAQGYPSLPAKAII